MGLRISCHRLYIFFNLFMRQHTRVTTQASGEAVSGGFILRLKAYDPVVAATSIELIEGTVARRLPTLSDVPCDRIVETTCIHDESIAPGGTYRSRNVEDYFDYPAGTDIDFRQAATGTPRVEGWTHRIVDGKLVVTVPSDPDADISPANLLIYLSAVDPDGGYARRMFSFTIGEEEEPSVQGAIPDAQCDNLFTGQENRICVLCEAGTSEAGSWSPVTRYGTISRLRRDSPTRTFACFRDRDCGGNYAGVDCR